MAIQIELPIPFPLDTVNAWLFPGEAPALVDCGLGHASNLEPLLAEIRKHVDPADLRLFITHGHVDHAGNAHALHDLGVPLIAPREEAPFVETFQADKHDRNDAFADGLRRNGMPADVVERIRARSEDIDQYLQDCPIDEDLPADTELLLGDDRVTAIRTPGHTPGSTCYLTDDNDLLSGDTLLETITSNALELKSDDLGNHHQYVRTVDAMRKYVGSTCLPGHRAPFELTDEVLDRHLRFHDKRAKKILGLLSRPRSAWELFPEVFPRLGDDEHYFMGMSEIVGHLQSLEIDGKVKRIATDGIHRFVVT